VDGEQIPDGDPIEVRIGVGMMQFPIDCNSAGGRFTLDGDRFDLGEWGSTDGGMPRGTERAAMFTDALERATRAVRSDGSLVLSGHRPS
jgi:heat shock protein HslJ